MKSSYYKDFGLDLLMLQLMMAILLILKFYKRLFFNHKKAKFVMTIYKH
jgi:hypothetical protein